MAISAVKFQLAMGDILGVNPLNLGTDSQKLSLTNTDPSANVATWHYFSSLTEISASNGYTAGGATLTVTALTNSSGTWSVNAAAASPTWTANTGTFGPFRWIHYYDATPAANKTLFCYWDYGSALSLSGTNGDTLTVTFSVAGVPMQLS